jgi:hypothetical protein
MTVSEDDHLRWLCRFLYNAHLPHEVKRVTDENRELVEPDTVVNRVDIGGYGNVSLCFDANRRCLGILNWKSMIFEVGKIDLARVESLDFGAKTG